MTGTRDEPTVSMAKPGRPMTMCAREGCSGVVFEAHTAQVPRWHPANTAAKAEATTDWR